MPNEYPIKDAAKTELQPVEGVVTYTGTLLGSKDKTGGRNALIFTTCIFALYASALFFIPSSPGSHASIRTGAELLGAMWAVLSSLIIIAAMPWRLALNYPAQTYISTFGYGSFHFNHSGPFADISGVSSVASTKMYSTHKHILILRFANGPIPRKMRIETGLSPDDAAARAQQLATALGTSFVDSYGQRINIDSPAPISNGQAQFTHVSTKYGRNVCRQNVIGIVFMALFFASIYPLFALTSPGGGAKGGVQMLLFFVLFYGWIIPIMYTRANPWRVYLDFAAGRYRLERGFRPFVRQRTGRFEDILGVRVIEIGSLAVSEPFAVSISFRAMRSMPFLLEPAFTRAQADKRAQQFAAILQTAVVDAEGSPVHLAKRQDLDGNNVTYTQDSIPRHMSRKQNFRKALIEALFPILCSPLLFYRIPYAGPSAGAAIFGALCMGCAILVWHNLLEAWPWRLALDYQNGKVGLTAGWLPLGFRGTGSFDRIEGVKVVPLLHGFYNEPYRIALCFATKFGRRSYQIETASSSDKAEARATHLAERLGVKRVTGPT
jgi:hypothetical protein